MAHLSRMSSSPVTACFAHYIRYLPSKLLDWASLSRLVGLYLLKDLPLLNKQCSILLASPGQPSSVVSSAPHPQKIALPATLSQRGHADAQRVDGLSRWVMDAFSWPSLLSLSNRSLTSFSSIFCPFYPLRPQAFSFAPFSESQSLIQLCIIADLMTP